MPKENYRQKKAIVEFTSMSFPDISAIKEENQEILPIYISILCNIFQDQHVAM